MAIVITRLAGPVALSNAAAVLFTCPTNSLALVQNCTFANTDVGNHTITVYVVPAGQGIGAGNRVIPSQSISALGTFQSRELFGVVLSPGDTIQALADTSGVVNALLDGILTGATGS
jgi:hypothetical protein